MVSKADGQQTYYDQMVAKGQKNVRHLLVECYASSKSFTDICEEQF